MACTHVMNKMDGPKVRSKQGLVNVDGVNVDVVCSNFGDTVLLLVTNLNKVGTLVS